MDWPKQSFCWELLRLYSIFHNEIWVWKKRFIKGSSIWFSACSKLVSRKSLFFFIYSLPWLSNCPDELQDYLSNLKLLVEDTFNKNNGKRTVFITHSMGSSNVAYFLSLQTQAWKDKYIQSWISLGGCFAGTIKAMKVYAEGKMFR